jgi:hypothetical protein
VFAVLYRLATSLKMEAQQEAEKEKRIKVKPSKRLDIWMKE